MKKYKVFINGKETDDFFRMRMNLCADEMIAHLKIGGSDSYSVDNIITKKEGKDKITEFYLTKVTNK